MNFNHRQTAHCESGAIANLLTHHGLKLSEPMAFGLGQGLFFGYFPFIRLNHLPLIAYRTLPGAILKATGPAVGARMEVQRFRDPERAMAELDRLLERDIPVGLQTGIYWLPYIPRAFRFHFNAHNLIVYGHKGDDYLISDPVMPWPTTCTRDDLLRARFAKGPLSPRGKMYHISDLNPPPSLGPAARYALQKNAGRLLHPVPLFGVKGIRFLAGRLQGWPEKMTREQVKLHLSQVIRMQEEIGTGGGGFRFIYAAFLQECGDLCDDPRLAEYSAQMTAAGDRWRDFATMAARFCKERPQEGDSFGSMAAILRECAAMEEQLFRQLQAL
ncbi:MAG: BtrH N-terminal domain-containing protein [Desulfurivibrio sp.]